MAKYDSTGKLLWAAEAGGTNGDWGTGVAVDGVGNCYVSGVFSGVASFGLTNLVGSMGFLDHTLFVAKYDPSGSLVWAREAVSDQDCEGGALAVDTNGNSYVTGSFRGSVTFGSLTLTDANPNHDENIFLAEYDADGNVLWAQQMGGIWDDGATSLTLDGKGNLYSTGFTGSGVNSPNQYVAKCDGGGNLLWSRTAGGGGMSAGYGIASDQLGSVFVTGYFFGTVSFGAVTLTSLGNEDAFLAKYGGDGSLLWIRQLGGTNSSATGTAAGTDPSGNCYVSGGFGPSLTTGLTNLVAVGKSDAFTAKYDAEGNLIWIVQIGGSGYNYIAGVASSPGRGMYLAGRVSQGTRFGNLALAGDASENFFLTRIDEMPVLSVTNTAANVLLSWPTNQVGFGLEWTDSLTPPVAWSTNTNPVQVSGDHYTVTDHLSAVAGFYRLSKP